LIDCAEAPLANAAAIAPITSGKYLIGSLHRYKVDRYKVDRYKVGFVWLRHRRLLLPGAFAPPRHANDAIGSALGWQAAAA
jgi:hypothetical protein